MSCVERAVELFKGGCACSQAVLGAYASEVGLDEGVAMRVAAGFAGGMRMGETCGAVTGAIMVLGLKCCSDGCNRPEGRLPVFDAFQEFQKKFTERNGDWSCKGLLGVNVSTAEGAQAAKEQGLFDRCPMLVGSAAEILEEIVGK